MKIKIGKVENKIPDHVKYITDPGFNKFAGSIFETKLKQVHLATKTDIDVVSQRFTMLFQNYKRLI